MQSSDLNRGQVAALRRKFVASLRYLAAVRERMDACRFPQTDPLYVSTLQAHGRMRCLIGELDYLLMALGQVKPATDRQPREERVEDIF